MKTNKKIVPFIVIIAGMISILLSITKLIQPELFVAIGSALIACGVVNMILYKLFDKIPNAKILDCDERNISIKGKASEMAYDVSDIAWLIVFIYAWIYKKDVIGMVLFIALYLLIHVVYLITYRKYDKID